MLIGLISEHYIEFVIILLEFCFMFQLLFVIFELQASVYYLLVSGQAQRVFRYTFLAFGYPSCSSPFQYPNALLSIQIGFKASEYHPQAFGYLSPQQSRIFSSASEYLLVHSNISLRHPNALVWHSDTPQQNLKNYLHQV